MRERTDKLSQRMKVTDMSGGIIEKVTIVEEDHEGVPQAGNSWKMLSIRWETRSHHGISTFNYVMTEADVVPDLAGWDWGKRSKSVRAGFHVALHTSSHRHHRRFRSQKISFLHTARLSRPKCSVLDFYATWIAQIRPISKDFFLAHCTAWHYIQMAFAEPQCLPLPVDCTVCAKGNTDM